MRHRGRLAAGLTTILVVAGVIVGLALAAGPGETQLVSQPSGNGGVPAGLTGDAALGSPGSLVKNGENANLSQDGRYVAFTSTADGLSSEDDDSVANVYVRDTQTDTTILVSRRSGVAGAPADADALQPAISDDGTRVAFETAAALDPVRDQNTSIDVYVRDLVTHATILVSAEDGGPTAVTAPATQPSIDADGSHVAFQTSEQIDSTNDTNGSGDIYVRAIATQDTTLASRITGGGIARFGTRASLSDSGDVVAFQTNSDDLENAALDTNGTTDVYVHTLSTGATVIASRATGAGTAAGNAFSRDAAISGDGTRVGFESVATDLVPADGNGSIDVFVRDLGAATTIRASVKDDGTEITGLNVGTHAALDDTGSRVAFQSQAQGLVAGDADSTTTTYVRDLIGASTEFVSRQTGVAGTVAGAQDATISGDGHTVAFVGGSHATTNALSSDDDDGFLRAFVRRRSTHPAAPDTTLYVTRPTGTAPFTGDGDLASTTGDRASSWDGRYVVFASLNDALVDTATHPDADTAGAHVFRRDTLTGTTIQLDLAGPDAAMPGRPAVGAGSFAPTISATGSRVAFDSQASDLRPVGSGGSNVQVYVRDVDAGTTEPVSRTGAAGALSSTICQESAISGDGNRVAFLCDDGADLDPGVDLTAFAGRRELYVRDIAAGTTTYVHQADDESVPTADPTALSLDWDGSHVALESVADLAPGTDNAAEDVFVRDIAGGTTVRASRAPGADGAGGDQPSRAPSLSGDATRVAFATSSGNLHPDATGGLTVVLVRDLTTHEVLLASDGSGGALPDGHSAQASLSEDGTVVAFRSTSTNLLGGSADSNGVADIFVKDLDDLAGDPVLASRSASPGDALGNAGSETPATSPDGNCVAFGSAASNLDPGWSTSDATQVFRRVVRGECPDTTPPDTAIDSGPDGATTDPTPTFTFAATERRATFTCALDGGPAAPCSSPFTTSALPAGPHSLAVVATDVVGNTDPTAAQRAFAVEAPDPPAAPAPPPAAPAPPPPAPPPPPPPSFPSAPVSAAPAPDHSAKIQVRRAGVPRDGSRRRLDVLARMTARVDDENVRITYVSSGRRTRFAERVKDGTIRISRRLPAAQSKKPTGIFTLRFAGKDGTPGVRDQSVRLRAADQKARLTRETLALRDGRLVADGKISRRARGVVRIRMEYSDAAGRSLLFTDRARIKDGEWSLDALLPPDARDGGYVAILFTGYEKARGGPMRGEQLAKAVGVGR